ncbi:MAG: sprT domain-containing protein [Bacteroidota bacterium]
MNQALRYEQVFQKYLPKPFVALVVNLLMQSNVQFKIVKSRSTKLGDFRPKNLQGKPQITVNGNLNPYAFLITTLHEFAHWKTSERYGRNAAPHGAEWKSSFASLIEKIIDHPELPLTLKAALKKSLTNPKASSCTDLRLNRVLISFDVPVGAESTLENLPKNATFALSNRLFVKGNKRRSRVECKELSSGKLYLVHLLAKVTPINEDERSKYL